MNKKILFTVWGFIEDNYHNYHGCDEIAWNGDLTKFVNDEFESEEEIIAAGLSGYTKERAYKELREHTDYLFDKAYSDYLFNKACEIDPSFD